MDRGYSNIIYGIQKILWIQAFVNINNIDIVIWVRTDLPAEVYGLYKICRRFYTACINGSFSD
jgi:hypothetical protein